MSKRNKLRKRNRYLIAEGFGCLPHEVRATGLSGTVYVYFSDRKKPIKMDFK